MKRRWSLRWYGWRDLPPDVLYAFLKLRSDIFVVEQNCVFSEMDGVDARCEHLCGYDDDALAGYLRLVPPGVRFPEPSLGRLVVAANARKHGVGRALMEEGLRRCAGLYPGQAILISAQQHLEGFYRSLGFNTVGAMYLEDGIAHLNMRCGR